MKTLRVKITFHYFDEDSYSWDYEEDNHIQPYIFEVEGRHHNQELCGNPDVDEDIAELYRYVCYRLGMDNIDNLPNGRNAFIKNFKETLKQLETHFNKTLLETNDLVVYGECTKKNPMFTPLNYEYTEKVPVKRLGKIKEGEYIPENHIEVERNVIYLTKPVSIFEEEAHLDENPEATYKFANGIYHLYKIHDAKKKLIACCLLKSDVDFYGVHWEDQYSNVNRTEPLSTITLCVKNVVKSGELKKILEESKGCTYKTDGQTYIAFSRNSSDNKNVYTIASTYLAKHEGKLVGFGIDMVDYTREERIKENPFLNDFR